MERPELTDLVNLGIEKARSHRIVREQDVAKFIDLMFALDLEFDTNPEFLWIQEILANKVLKAEARLMEIMSQLHNRQQPQHRNADF